VPSVDCSDPSSVGAASVPPTVTAPRAPTSTPLPCTRTSLPALTVSANATGSATGVACGLALDDESSAVSGMRVFENATSPPITASRRPGVFVAVIVPLTVPVR
jgi:hypothetical protein